MRKYFCDVCGDEITQNNTVVGPRDRLTATIHVPGTKRKYSVEVITGLDGCANDGDFCKYCVLEALQKLDDREKETAP